MPEIGINQKNVGRIAERIVANELEYGGFRVSDLNKEGTSANADLLAAKGGKTWQIQVKGSTEDGGWWFNYGHCDEDMLKNKSVKMFNRGSGFYKAEVVVLVSVKSPAEYVCIVLHLDTAEKLVQMNLDYAFRKPKKDGQPKKAGKTWSWLDHLPNTKDLAKLPGMKAEQDILKSHRDKWDIISP